MAYYLIHNTCPDLYNKYIRKVVTHLKRDKLNYAIAEIEEDVEHAQGCNKINNKGVSPYIRKSKACLTCPYKPEGCRAVGRKNSTKTTIITIVK